MFRNFATSASRFGRLAATSIKQQQEPAKRNAAAKMQRRNMGTDPNKKWDNNVDAFVRSYFPYDHQLAMAILGFYTGIYVLFKIKGALTGKKEEEPAVAAVAAAPTGDDVPGVETPEFEKFVETEAFLKLLEDPERIVKLVEAK